MGTALLEVTDPRQPCRTFAARMGSPMAVKLMQQSGRFGWYYQVIEEGEVRAGDPIEVNP